MRGFAILFLIFLTACQSSPMNHQDWVDGDFTTKSGWVSVFQTMTSDTETTINIMRPHLAEMAYVVQPYVPGQELEFKWDPNTAQKVIKTTSGPQIYWKVDRIHLKNLKPGVRYGLYVVNKWRKKAVDFRVFKTMNIKSKKAKFIVGSCMSDSHAFEHVRNRIWDRMLSDLPDFIMLLGDQVYVDDFDFVKRGKATEHDIWRRYVDTFRKIPLFQRRQLVPLLGVWDDHDYGTNNSDKNFKSKKAAKKVFQAFFGGENIPGVTTMSNNGVSFAFNGFGQKFLLMDDRYFRDSSKTAPYGQWGKQQHQWFMSQVKAAKEPIWLANGGQFFTEATVVTKKDGKKKQVNESFKDDHPKHFQTLIADLKKASVPAVFLSGDIHYSEIARVEPALLGYETFEVTSSPLHSYIFRSKKGKESWLKNPRRIISVKEHNYLLLESEAQGNTLKINVKSFGVKQPEAFFEKDLLVKK